MATSKSDLSSIVSEEVECAICLERLDKPRILSCLHSFCEKCLTKCAENQNSTILECSLCKTTTTIPAEGVSGLKTDFRAARLLEALQENETRNEKLTGSSRNCDVCGYVDSSKKNSQFTFCRECSQVLCNRCASVHVGLRSTQDHTVAKIADLLSGRVTIQPKKQVAFCQKHADEKLKLFCLTCSEPICHDCTLFDHNRDTHDFKFLTDLSNNIKTELTEKLSKVRSQTKKLSEFLGSLDEVDGLIQQHGKHTVQDIEDTFRHHVEHVKSLQKFAIDNQEKFLTERAKEVQELRQQTKLIKELGEHSSLMTEKVLDNSEDVISMASMYKSLREALDKAIASEPDKLQKDSIITSVEQLHRHTEAKLAKVIKKCPCKERNEIVIVCRSGPKCVQFSHDERLTVLTEDSPFNDERNLYVMDQNYNVFIEGPQYSCIYPAGSNLKTSFRQTATSFPTSTTFTCQHTIPTLLYNSITCCAPLSDNRSVIVDSNKIYLLTDVIYDFTDMLQGLPDNRSISAVATDFKDHIYLADKNNQRIYIIRDDGSLHKNLAPEQISPTGIAVSNFRPDRIVVTHDPATVSILDLEGKVLSSIHQDTWVKVNIGCSTGRLHILWSDAEGKVTLQRYTMKGTLVDTLIDKEVLQCQDLLLAVSPDGLVAIVTAKGVNGKVLVINPPK